MKSLRSAPTQSSGKRANHDPFFLLLLGVGRLVCQEPRRLDRAVRRWQYSMVPIHVFTLTPIIKILAREQRGDAIIGLWSLFEAEHERHRMVAFDSSKKGKS